MKKLILILILASIIVPFTFSFSEESRADLKRAASWWGERADELQYKLGDIGRKNPDPSNPNDKNWKEYLRITAEIQKAEEKQKLYEDTALFNYYRSISRDTAKVYRPVGDFMEFTVGRGVELVTAVITQSWTDLVKLAVDSVLRTRIRGKIRSILDCDETVIELEKWMVVIGFGEDPWATSFDQAIVNWAKGDVKSKAMLLTLQKEKGRQIYKSFLEKPEAVHMGDLTPSQWLESKSLKSAEDIMDKLGLANFIGEMAGKMWLSFEMDESIDNTLLNLKAMRDKYKENGKELSCKDIFLVWSKQKTIDLTDDPDEKKRLKELKLGLDFFIKKIPGWYSSKTVPDHFDEIVRMIPIAEELGEHATAGNLRDILVEFEYKEMTPKDIADSELQSSIEESRKYLISNLKILRNYLKNQLYEEVESQWERTQDKWNELIALGHDTDNDTEIQNLWAEIQYLLEQKPETIDDNTSGEDPQTILIDNSTSVPVTTDSSSSEIKQAANEYKKNLLAYAYQLLSALEDDDYNRQEQIENKANKYNEGMKSGILHDEIWNDSKFTSEVNTVYKKIGEVINDSLINGKNVYSSGVTWLWEWQYNSSTSNSSF